MRSTLASCPVPGLSSSPLPSGGRAWGDVVKAERRVGPRSLGVETFEGAVEDLLAAELAVCEGVVALALEDWAELDSGLEEGAGFADRFELAVEVDGGGRSSRCRACAGASRRAACESRRLRRRRGARAERRIVPRPRRPRSTPRPRSGRRCGHTPWSCASSGVRAGQRSLLSRVHMRVAMTRWRGVRSSERAGRVSARWMT